MKRATLWLIGGLALAAGVGAGDTIVVGTQTHSGTLQSYEKNAFRFRTQAGEWLTQDRMAVRRITVDAPRKAMLDCAGRKAPEAVAFLGYENKKFLVSANGKREEVAGLKVRRLSIEDDMRQMGGASSETPRARERIDLSGVEGRAGLSAVQTALIERYRAAWSDYERFLDESTAMAGRLDTLTGAQRATLLNELRARKNREQPLTQVLAAAETAVRAAFPELTAGGSGPSVPSAASHKPARQAGVAGGPPPSVGKDEVLLIDTADLEAHPDLTTVQRAALQRYKVARTHYERVAAQQVGALGNQDLYDSALRSTKEALDGVLTAFPGLQFSGE
jgi:hypothetical protein